MFSWFKRFAAHVRSIRHRRREAGRSDPVADKAVIRRALGERLSPHLLKDLGGED
jgi:hypothetical protein